MRKANTFIKVGKRLNSRLGTFLKSLRKEKKLTLKELSELSGISFAQIGKIERGETHPKKNTILKIAQALSYNQNDLFHLAGYVSDDENTQNNITPELKYMTLIKYDRTCQMCGVKAPFAEIEITGINPNKKTYYNTDNLVTLCKSCNKSRNKLISEQGIENDYFYLNLKKNKPRRVNK